MPRNKTPKTFAWNADVAPPSARSDDGGHSIDHRATYVPQGSTAQGSRRHSHRPIRRVVAEAENGKEICWKLEAASPDAASPSWRGPRQRLPESTSVNTA
jgi:hypothetical protein